MSKMPDDKRKSIVKRAKDLASGKRSYTSFIVLALLSIVRWTGVDVPIEVIILVAALGQIFLRAAVSKAERPGA